MAPETLPPDRAGALAEFARTAKAAARAVSLYPPTHPSIQSSLARVVAAAARLTATGAVTLSVQPDAIALDSMMTARPDPAVGELATLLHERLVGALRIEPAAAAEDWLALLLLLGRAPDDLFAGGGIARAWGVTGRTGFELREIDYAEVLRERAGGESAAWDRIVAFCLQGDGGQTVDDSALAAVAALIEDPDRFGALIDRLDQAAAGTPVGVRAAALMKLLRTIVDAAGRRGAGDRETLLQTAAASAARLTPDMLLGLIAQARQAGAEDGAMVDDVLGRMSDQSIAGFVATSVIAERGATERLAQAFEALVPELTRKERLLEQAHDDVAASPVGAEAGFEDLWKSAADMLTSYSDRHYVSAEYGRELSGARAQAMEIERVSDDPPDRVQAWLATVSDASIGELDIALILDLLRIEDGAGAWRDLAAIATREIERRTVLGAAGQVLPLLNMLVQERSDAGRPGLGEPAAAALDALARGPLVRHIVLQLRIAEDGDVEPVSRMCHAIGPAIVRPLAEALAVEDNATAIRRLRELLLGFGAAGRQSVEQLKSSSNPAVRRTAIDLLRVFGGQEALPELASMLDDADPQVQRESIRAIVQIGTREASAILERALAGGGARRAGVLQQLIALRDDKAIPLLCYVLNNTAPRGALVQAHIDIMEALGGLSPHPEATRSLRAALYRGTWWAPGRTALLRGAAATALRRLGSPESLAVLEEALASGGRGVRNAARPHAGATLRRERVRS
jgi:hypothetical protein